VSTNPSSNPFPAAIGSGVRVIAAPAQSASRVLRRQPTMEQGRALEKLAHAIEYLVDSRLWSDRPWTRADAEAGRMLMRLNCEIFAECREVVPIGSWLKSWLLRWMVEHHPI